MIKRITYGVIFGSVLIITGVIFLCAFIVLPDAPQEAVVEKEPILFCGTPNPSQKSAKGREIMNSNCAACHKADIDLGNGTLRGIDKNYNAAFLMDYINNEDSLIKANNSIVKQLHEKYGENDYKHKNEFTKEEIESLIYYLAPYQNNLK
ncbi:cytochrome c [Flavobacterium rakeshii]|uniref:c-type cytochrome n=1 Tax=Flavobacterium rakeshii TaxID=1038845 RepID=UPI002E7BF32B|nr:cytochrome c [Flavobacterium rakeshii]MEE1897127.1 cytochrome c [Flavobacterium rakeshii]